MRAAWSRSRPEDSCICVRSACAPSGTTPRWSWLRARASTCLWARTRYLNIEISQISPKYVFDFASYKKTLEQRNRLLRDLRERPYRDSGLDAWNEQLVHYGAPLLEKRRFFLDRLSPLADEVHRE